MTTAQAHNAQAMTNEQLVAEMMRRAILPTCVCGKHSTYILRGWSQTHHDGDTYRCAGCLRAIGKCTC